MSIIVNAEPFLASNFVLSFHMVVLYMNIKVFTLLLLTLFFVNISATAQKIAVKSNMLYDVTTSLNIGTEFRLGTQTTFDLSVNYNPWTFSDNKKMKHILVQPEVRLWTCEPFFGHFWGVHAHYAYYNIGGMPIFDALKDHRYEGWLAGGGLTYGYHWALSNRWSLEASIGLGYAFIDYSKYECEKCGRELTSKTKNYVGPTKVGVSLIYFLK